MSLFQYPKARHARTVRPRLFKRYQPYKRYLQTEFTRLCVYCRQPDSSAPSLNFHVDHYRPKSLAQFAHLGCDYSNLYYSCQSCNTRKSNYWPRDEKRDPFIVNPCDHEMASHLRFDARSGRFASRSDYGRFTEELLDLNDETAVEYRLNTLAIVNAAERDIRVLEADLRSLDADVLAGRIDASLLGTEREDMIAAIARARSIIAAQTGTTALPALPRRRNGLDLLA